MQSLYICRNPNHPEHMHSRQYDSMTTDGFCPDCDHGAGILLPVDPIESSRYSFQIPPDPRWYDKLLSPNRVADEDPAKPLLDFINTATQGVSTLAVDNAGQQLALKGHDRTIRLWDLVYLREKYILYCFERRFTTGISYYWKVCTPGEEPKVPEREMASLGICGAKKLLFSPDGCYLAIMGSVVYLWRIGFDMEAWQLKRYSWSTFDMSMFFSADSRYLIIEGSIPKHEVWSTSTLQVQPDEASMYEAFSDVVVGVLLRFFGNSSDRSVEIKITREYLAAVETCRTPQQLSDAVTLVTRNHPELSGIPTALREAWNRTFKENTDWWGYFAKEPNNGFL